MQSPATNYGLLLRADTGGLQLLTSQYKSLTIPTSARPLLDLVFQAPGWTGYPDPPPSPSPSPAPLDLGNTDPQPPALRNADGSCAVLPGTAFTMDISSAPVAGNSA